jgi:NAD(P)-dependent dehydrogenase (short-subunit alcohol dehydrogenase family)
VSTILITGANKGLGRETARRLLAEGHTIWVGARDGALGEQAARELGARFVQLDVTDQGSVEAVAARIEAEHGMGSLAITTDPERLESSIVGLAYPSSKTAVNMLTSQYAKAYPQMRINAVDPGYTATDLNQHRGIKTVEEGAQAIVWAASLGAEGPTGGFFDAAGAVPW